MSHAYISSQVIVSDREHTWADADDGVFSTLCLGDVDITFDSAEEARQVAARCLQIGDAIDAKRAEAGRR